MARHILKFPVTGYDEVVVDGDTPEESIANYEAGKGYDYEKDVTDDTWRDGTYKVIGYYDDEGNYEER